jgi:pectin methylesterase-like acyl-CoA thioesterase
MYQSEVAGQTDFFYGFGTCWVTDSLVSLRGCGGGITAWKGSNATFVNKYGVYIHDSTVQKANSSISIEHQCALGRPWNALHRSIFANTYLDDSIRPSGYIQWSASDPRVNYSESLSLPWPTTDDCTDITRQTQPWQSTKIMAQALTPLGELQRPILRSR